VVAFGGRVLDETQPKYLNSPEHVLFSKGKLLFGLYYASKAISQAGYAILMEGYMDCLAAWEHDVPNAVASLGTALTPVQARLLRRYTEQVTLCYDGDNAGLQAALRGMDILEQAGLAVKVAVLPPGEDPDDCLRRHGREYFQQEVLQKAKSLLDFRLEMLRRQFDLHDVAGKAQFVVAATAVLAKLDNEVLRVSYAERIAHELQVSVDAVLIELAKHGRGQSVRTWDKNGNSRNTNKDSAYTVIGGDDLLVKGCQAAESVLLSLLLHNLAGAEELLLEWQAENVYAHPADRQLVEAMLQQLQSGQPIDANRLLEQVTDKAVGQRLAEVAWADQPSEQNAEVVARDCMLKLKQMAIREAIADRQKQLVTAQGPAARTELLRELQTLIEKQKVLRH
jgi:DNA primase